MPKDRILLKNCNIITPNKSIKKGVNIEVDNGIISSITHKASSDGLIIDCSKKYVLPGFINAHAHCYQNLIRSLGSDLKLIDWLKSVKYPVCEIMDKDDVFIATIIAHLEMMRSGITTVIDNFDFKNDLEGMRALAKACENSGMRVAIARGMRVRTRIAEKWKIPEWIIPYDEKTELNISEQSIKEFDGKLNGRLRIMLSPTALFYSTKDLLLGCKELSKKYGVCIHIHIAEGKESQKACVEMFGKREVELLNELEMLNERFHAVHAIDLSNNEIDALSLNDCTVIHNPISNMYLATGISPVFKLIRKGINVALGTDGAGSNDSYNFFETMKVASLLQKVISKKPNIISAEEIFKMATLNGAKALLNEKIGRIEEGYKADLIVINLNKVSSLPDYKPLNSIVYSGNPSNVEHVIIDGEIIMLNGKFIKIDEDKLLEKFIKTIEKITLKIKNSFNLNIMMNYH
jgi:5-methylthioadenosine/S-adenosylhomocysteine deaminase